MWGSISTKASIVHLSMIVVAVFWLQLTAQAAQPPAANGEVVLPPVDVGAVRRPVDKSYRKMIRGMDLFETKRAMAPAATLRFKLLPRQKNTDMNGIQINIVGDTVAIPARVAADHSFVLERDRKAYDEDASVISDRPVNSMTWRVEIRTAGLPPNTRRLGDLRLECLVGMESGLVSPDPPVIGALANMVRSMVGYCTRNEVRYVFFADRPLFSVTLNAGARRETLSVDDLYAGVSAGRTPSDELPYCDCEYLLDRTFYLPLGDTSWPDDTWVELEYMDDDTMPPAPGTAAQ
jgi:hypothetical protein